MSETKAIWFEIHRLYQTDAGNSPKKTEVKNIEVNEDDIGEEIRQKIRSDLGLDDQGLIIKVRNERGSLIPINKRLESNSQENPYKLEIVRRHQNIAPLSRSVKLESYNETMKLKLVDIITRIEKLESSCPQLQSKRDEKVHAELEDIDRKLNFLNKRIAEADDANWTGMFRKNPLW
ncbi:uncharacterized protein LOC126811423 [Patella vulgata]|uniref:uncharacterized protein LOC126811423 n=1 Tax=Patella vulgata TaxID=6465 RepID=UPI0024A87EBC|nr:uncharacterized protein LOC126811423 [Patella vulgata]